MRRAIPHLGNAIHRSLVLAQIAVADKLAFVTFAFATFEHTRMRQMQFSGPQTFTLENVNKCTG